MNLCSQRSRSLRRMCPGRRSRSRFQRDCKHSPSEVNRNPAGPKDSTSKKPVTASILPTTALRSFNVWYLSSCGFYNADMSKKRLIRTNTEKEQRKKAQHIPHSFPRYPQVSVNTRGYLVNVLQIREIGLDGDDNRGSIICGHNAL